MCASGSVFTGGLPTPIHQLLTIVARPTRLAVTGEIAIDSRRIAAGSSIFTGIFVPALRSRQLAIGSGEAIGTNASVVVDAVDARTPIDTGGRCAIFVVDLTVCARKTTAAVAGVGIDVVMASCSILTRIGGAFVDVDLTLVTIEAINAETFEAVSLVQTSSAVQTRLFLAVIDIDKAITAFEAVAAIARVAPRCIDTLATITARRRHGTFVNVLVAEATREA